MPVFCCRCGSRLVCTDSEAACKGCGYVPDAVMYGEDASFRDEDGKSTSQHAPGLGTDAAKAASKYLKTITKGHVLKSQNNKYLVYAFSCLRNFVKSDIKFRNLYDVLRALVEKTVTYYMDAKKMAREGIGETRVITVVKGKKETRIRYYAIDRIMERTILAFCSKNMSFVENIKVESFDFHKIVRHSTQGNKRGTMRENGYKEPNPALDVLSCLKHGPFPEKSHNAHFKNADHVINDRQVTFPTYQKYFVLGFSFCGDILKNSVKQNHAKRQNILRGYSKRCEKCNCEIKEEVRISYRDTKNQKHKKYTSVIEYHVLRINGRKVKIKGCLEDYNANNTAGTLKQNVLFNLWYDNLQYG
ncbi:MAG: hypothetical protein KGL95_13160, partial [Patescibacteria group bacterium]|nr:hypothetical protein [Patescibacteria group bacterium]